MEWNNEYNIHLLYKKHKSGTKTKSTTQFLFKIFMSYLLKQYLGKMSTITLLCRFCAKEQPQQSVINLKTDKLHRRSIKRKLCLFGKFVDFTNKSLPETVCTACYSILNTSFKFFVQVQESQVLLSRLCNVLVVKEYQESIGIVKEEFDVLGYDSGDRDTKPDLDSSDTEDHPVAWSTYPWRCAYCNITLPSMQAVREHSQEAHETCYGFQCADCDVKTDGFEEFLEHVRRKRKALAKYCEYCNIKMETYKHTELHTSNHICTYCGQMFTEERSLHNHLKKYVTKPSGFLTFGVEICEDAQYKTYETTNLINNSQDRMYNRTNLINNGSYRNFRTNNTINEISNDTTYISINAMDKLNKTIDCKNVSDTENRIYNTKISTWSQYPLICKFCNIKVAYKDMLKEHCIVTHKKCFGMKCVDCDYVDMDTFEQFVQHARTHRPYLKKICQYCGSKTNDYEHIQTHIGRYQCSVCGENFRGIRDLRRHDNKLEKPNLKPPKKRRRGPVTDKDVTCNICGKRMKTPLSLRAHKLTHTERKRNHTCDRCGKAFYTKASMEVHHKIHEDIEKEICKICNKSFLTVQRLRKHVKTHNLEMPFQCDDCKKLFSSKDSLRAHVTVHMNIKPYECQYCGKRFRNKHTMKTHENQHTGARPYSCDVCCINFACWSNCDKHMRRIHGTPLAKSVKTPHGKLAIDPETGKPSTVSMTSVVKEWSRSILEKSLRKFKRNNEKMEISKFDVQ